ncbi:putative membrane protein [Bacteroides fragilis str. 2-F-2 |nr:putative membrane protein [Bacteroides fragilis str. 2-F-2 \
MGRDSPTQSVFKRNSIIFYLLIIVLFKMFIVLLLENIKKKYF